MMCPPNVDREGKIMADQKVRHLLGKLQADPNLASQLAGQRDPKARHDLLAKSGVISAGDTPPTQEEIRKEVIALLTPAGGGGQQPQQGERLVEWVAAIATAAALL
jgi:hypothetical protein